MGTDNRDIFGKPLCSIDEILAMQEKDGEPIRLAVEEVLLPSLEGDAATLGRELADKYGAYNLYAATEAVNTFLMRVQEAFQPQKVMMRHNGDIVADNRTIYVVDLALEVARFMELWKDGEMEESGRQPNADTFVIVYWMWKAMKKQPYLLSDFVATVTDDPNCLLLTEVVDPKDRIADDRQRWSRKK